MNETMVVVPVIALAPVIREVGVADEDLLKNVELVMEIEGDIEAIDIGPRAGSV